MLVLFKVPIQNPNKLVQLAPEQNKPSSKVISCQSTYLVLQNDTKYLELAFSKSQTQIIRDYQVYSHAIPYKAT